MPKLAVTKEQVKRYFDAWREIMADRTLTPSAKVVLWTIQDTNFDTFFMSQNKMAKKLGYAQSKISEAITLLEGKKKIVVGSRPLPGSHKPLKITLAEELKPFFIREKKRSLISENGYDLSKNGYEENQKTSLSYPKTDTNVINDTKLTILQNSGDPTLPNASQKEYAGKVELRPDVRLSGANLQPAPYLPPLAPGELATLHASLPKWLDDGTIVFKKAEYDKTERAQRKKKRETYIEGLTGYIEVAINNKWLRPPEERVMVGTTGGEA